MRLTYPAPRRYSERTGSRMATHSIWRLRLEKEKGKEVSNLLLCREEKQVYQQLFTSESWTEGTALLAILGGAWFASDHDFASKREKQFAFDAQATLQLLLLGDLSCQDEQQ